MADLTVSYVGYETDGGTITLERAELIADREEFSVVRLEDERLGHSFTVAIIGSDTRGLDNRGFEFLRKLREAHSPLWQVRIIFPYKGHVFVATETKLTAKRTLKQIDAAADDVCGDYWTTEVCSLRDGRPFWIKPDVAEELSAFKLGPVALPPKPASFVRCRYRGSDAFIWSTQDGNPRRLRRLEHLAAIVYFDSDGAKPYRVKIEEVEVTSTDVVFITPSAPPESLNGHVTRRNAAARTKAPKSGAKRATERLSKLTLTTAPQRSLKDQKLADAVARLFAARAQSAGG